MGARRVYVGVCLLTLVLLGVCFIPQATVAAGAGVRQGYWHDTTYTPPEPDDAVSKFEQMLKDVTSNIWIVVIALFFLASAYFVVRVLFFAHSQEEAMAAKKNLGVTVVGTMVAGGSWIIYTALKYWLFS